MNSLNSNPYSSDDNKDSLNQQGDNHLKVYPLLTLDRLKLQAERVARLVYVSLDRAACESDHAETKPRPQAETNYLNLIRKIGEAFYQLDDGIPIAEAIKAMPDKNRARPIYQNVSFFEVLCLLRSFGLPLDGEISFYRHFAFFAPTLDALAEKSEKLLGELLTLLVLIKLAQHYQDFNPDDNEKFSAFIKASFSQWVNGIVDELIKQGGK